MPGEELPVTGLLLLITKDGDPCRREMRPRSTRTVLPLQMFTVDGGNGVNDEGYCSAYRPVGLVGRRTRAHNNEREQGLRQTMLFV